MLMEHFSAVLLIGLNVACVYGVANASATAAAAAIFIVVLN